MSSRRSSFAFWGVFLGNLFEHYEVALYSFLVPFLAPLFFPSQDPISELLLAYAIIPLGMLARPLGALFFGKMGDLYGRRHSLSLSLFGMALISLAIALCPTYDKIGIGASLLLCFAKILQNFLSAGEVMGGAIFLLENSPNKKHDLLSSLYNASSIAGIMLASSLVFLLSFFHLLEKGWRFLYLFGVVTALFGYFFRRQPEKENKAENKPRISLPIGTTANVLWKMRFPLLVIAITSGFSYATYSLALVLMNGFIPLISLHTKESMLSINTLLLALDFAMLPLFGWLASKVQREVLMFGAAFFAFATAVPLSIILEGADLWTVILVRFLFVFLGVAFSAPHHAFVQNLVPREHRYLILSMGYALGSQVLGSPTLVVSLWIYNKTGLVWSISWYWGLLAVLTSLIMLKELKNSCQISHIVPDSA